MKFHPKFLGHSDWSVNHFSVFSTSHILIRKPTWSFPCRSEVNIRKLLGFQNRLLGGGCCLWPHLSISSHLHFYFQMFVSKIKLVLFKMWQTGCTEGEFFCLEKVHLPSLIITEAEKTYLCCWLIAMQNVKGKVCQPTPSLQALVWVGLFGFGFFFSGNP